MRDLACHLSCGISFLLPNWYCPRGGSRSHKCALNNHCIQIFPWSPIICKTHSLKRAWQGRNCDSNSSLVHRLFCSIKNWSIWCCGLTKRRSFVVGCQPCLSCLKCISLLIGYIQVLACNSRIYDLITIKECGFEREFLVLDIWWIDSIGFRDWPSWTLLSRWLDGLKATIFRHNLEWS